MPHQKLPNCEIFEYLTIANNNHAITTILNNTTNLVTLNFSETIVVEKFDRKAISEMTSRILTNPPNNIYISLN